jgi:peptidoglycan/LPS O-acetylase OafA/YrhL
MTPPPDRYHALDALRGFAMLLGVLLHAAIPYVMQPVPFWPVQDDRGHPVFDLFLVAIHEFRMQAFFLLAGFFGALLYARYGLGRTARHRLKRIALPLALGMLTIQPATQAVSVYAFAATERTAFESPGGPPILASSTVRPSTPTEAVVEHFRSGAFLRLMIPLHLWFLWYLLIFFAVLLPLAWVADRFRDRPAGRAWDAAARWLLRSRVRWLMLATLTWILLVPMAGPAGPDTPLGWVPTLPLLGYYFLFVLVGWTLYRHRDLLASFAGGWRPGLVLANAIVLPMALVALYLSVHPHEAGTTDGESFLRISQAAQALYTWLMVGGLVGLFLHWLSRERAWVRWLADSAYWCYLASLPPIILLQYLLIGWEAPSVVKCFVVTTATLAVLLATYRWCVRYTWIGRLLNGPRAS